MWERGAGVEGLLQLRLGSALGHAVVAVRVGVDVGLECGAAVAAGQSGSLARFGAQFDLGLGVGGRGGLYGTWARRQRGIFGRGLVTDRLDLTKKTVLMQTILMHPSILVT